MAKIHDVAVLVGSLRKDSINRKVANALAEIAPDRVKLSIVEIGHLPIYNQDGDDNPPADGRRSASGSRRPTRFSSSPLSIIVRSRRRSRMPWISARGPMARAHGAASRPPSSPRRPAASAGSAPTTICDYCQPVGRSSTDV
jgi:chromate reductase